jgi:ribosomal protein S18 acetylase RimI-like enzyme
MSEITFRTPIIDEAAAYRNLRLNALQEFPTAFSSSFEDQVNRDLAYWQKYIELAQDKNTEIMIMAYDGDKMIGMGVIFWDDKPKIKQVAHMAAIYVDKNYQGKGIGYRLVKTLIEEAKKVKQLRKLKLEVESTNKPAYELYKKLGFEEIGLSKGEIFHDGKYYDNILMELLLK